MNTPVVVVLSKYPEIFEGFRREVNIDFPNSDKVVVWDGDDRPKFGPASCWNLITTGQPFHMAINGNLALAAAGGEDCVYCGDDVRFIEHETISRLQTFAYSDPAIGIVAPRIKDQDAPHEGEIEIVPFVTFPMIYLKAEVIRAVGYLDEFFEGYGWEDLSYCVRVRQAGFKIAYANQVHIQHGVDGCRWGSTFFRTIGQDRIEADMAANMKRFAARYGIEPDAQRVWDFVRNLC